MAKFEIEFSFLMHAHTTGYTIEATSAEDANAKAAQCVDEHGELDFKKLEALGGDISQGAWDVESGTDHCYVLNEDITEKVGE